jgi:hypothetical protein
MVESTFGRLSVITVKQMVQTSSMTYVGHVLRRRHFNGKVCPLTSISAYLVTLAMGDLEMDFSRPTLSPFLA